MSNNVIFVNFKNKGRNASVTTGSQVATNGMTPEEIIQKRTKKRIITLVDSLKESMSIDDWSGCVLIKVKGSYLAAWEITEYYERELFLGRDGNFYVTYLTAADKIIGAVSSRYKKSHLKIMVDDLRLDELLTALEIEIVSTAGNLPDDEDDGA